MNYDSVFFAQKSPGYSSDLPKQGSSFPLKVATVSPQGSMAGWGWVCRAEYKFQQATKLPLYFRLGNKEYTDNLEGK